MHTEGQAHIPKSDTTNMSATRADLDDEQNIDIAALKAEVAKWQERVPKLAKALRERTDELAQTREQLREAQASPHTSEGDGQSNDARLAARNQLIEELQQKVADLGDKHRKAAGELHTTQLDLDSVREEADSWRAKWQDVTASLDDAVEGATKGISAFEQAQSQWQADSEALKQTHKTEVERLQRDTESLRVRNANLGETIEFANKQIASLGEDMALLVEQAKSRDEALESLQSEQATTLASLEQQQAQSIALESQLADRQGALDDVQSQLQNARDASVEQLDRIEELQTQLASAQQEAEQALAEQASKLQQEVRELEAKLVVEDERYTQAMQAAEDEQTQLSQLLDDKDEKIKKLEAQKAEQAQAQQALEQSLTDAQQKVASVDAQVAKDKATLEDTQQQLAAATERLEEFDNRAQAANEEAIRAEQAAQALAAARDELQATLDQTQASHADALAIANTQAQKAQEQATVLEQDVSALRAELTEHNERYEAVLDELKTLQAERQRWTDIEQDLLEQVNAVTSSGEQKQRELDDEIQRLSECVSQAQDSNQQRETERRELAEKLDIFEDENAKLKSNLAERSTLVRELEEERQRNVSAQTDTEAQFADISKQLTEARHKMSTFQEHAENLEAKLVTQQGLMSELEVELSDSQEEHAAALKAVEATQREVQSERGELAQKLTQSEHRCDDLAAQKASLESAQAQFNEQIDTLMDEVGRERKARQDQQNAVHTLQAELENLTIAHKQEIAVLQTQQESGQADATEEPANHRLRELEQLLRERTQELDKLRWRLEQQPPQTDENVVLILNQQLDDARAENKRLKEKLAGSQAVVDKADDLTELKGVGAKLAEQLNELGVNTFAQISALDIQALESEDHPLHGFKSRIERDDWIAQAKKILKSKG